MAKTDNTTGTKLSQIQPAPGYLFIEPDDQPTQTSSGIYLPDSAKGDKPQEGKVLAVGAPAYQDGQKIDSPAKKNDKVIYKKWGGNDVEIDRVEYQFLKFDDILAIVTKSKSKK